MLLKENEKFNSYKTDNERSTILRYVMGYETKNRKTNKNFCAIRPLAVAMTHIYEFLFKKIFSLKLAVKDIRIISMWKNAYARF